MQEGGSLRGLSREVKRPDLYLGTNPFSSSMENGERPQEQMWELLSE